VVRRKERKGVEEVETPSFWFNWENTQETERLRRVRVFCAPNTCAKEIPTPPLVNTLERRVSTERHLQEAHEWIDERRNSFAAIGRGEKLCRANPKSVGGRNMLPRLREANTATRVTKP